MDYTREDLMEIYKNPTNKGIVDDPSVKVHENNPLCGDNIDLSIKIKDGVIKEVKFDGSACSVSIISSELLLDFVKGKTIDEVSKITKDDLLNLVDLNLTTSRVKCATLVLFALQKAITRYKEKK